MTNVIKTINYLKELPHFEKIDSNILRDLIKKGAITKHKYKKGITLHEEKTACNAIDIVFSGELLAYTLTANGSETVIFEFNKNSIIGANLLFGDHNKYPMNIYCASDCIIFRLPKSAVLELLEINAFVLPFVKSLSLNSQGMNQKIDIYKLKSLRENIVNYLTALSAMQDSNTITLPISKKQLADYLGVQRPSLFRELKKMKDEGIIEINNRKITILTPI